MRLLVPLTTAYTATTYLVEDSADLETLCTTLSTTTSSLGNPAINIQVNAANNYVDSLTTEQLAEFDEMLSQKEDELVLENGQKVIIPEIKSEEATKTYKKI